MRSPHPGSGRQKDVRPGPRSPVPSPEPSRVFGHVKMAEGMEQGDGAMGFAAVSFEV
jgi:hypothetical protein